MEVNFFMNVIFVSKYDDVNKIQIRINLVIPWICSAFTINILIIADTIDLAITIIIDKKTFL